MAKKHFYLFLICVQMTLYLNHKAFSQENNINAKFSSEAILIINENESATFTEKGKFTILNEDGLKYCKHTFAYAFNSKITNISASITNSEGKVIKKLKKSDIYDTNAQSSNSLFIDTRLKSFYLAYNEYPFVLEYEVTMKYAQTFAYPSFIPKMDYKFLNLSSKFKLIAPKLSAINIYEQNISKNSAINNGNNLIYEWKVDSLPAIADEIFSYSEYWDAPKVLIVPSKFKLEFIGSNNSWIEFGN